MRARAFRDGSAFIQGVLADARRHLGDTDHIVALLRNHAAVRSRIASIALRHGLVLLTGNTRHYERLPGLRIENWLPPRERE